MQKDDTKLIIYSGIVFCLVLLLPIINAVNVTESLNLTEERWEDIIILDKIANIPNIWSDYICEKVSACGIQSTILKSTGFVFNSEHIGIVDGQYEILTNYSTLNVNNSEYWNGNAWSDTRWLNIDGSNANQDVDIRAYDFYADDGFFDYLNFSYLRSSFGGVIDATGDPWYLSGTNFQVADNVIASWFKGKFNWTSSDNWNIFDGSTLDFNESKLSSVYFNATQSQLISGTLDGGSLIDTQHNDADYDSITMNFSEASGSPALDLRVNFTGVSDFSRGVMRYKTGSISGDYPVRQLWNYDSSSWDTLTTFTKSDSFAIVTQPVFNNANYVQDEVVQLRIYKSSNGNPNNHYYVDWVAMVGGYGVPSGHEVDPYSVHKTGDTMTGNLETSGNITADWLNADYTNVSGLYTCDNGTATIMTRNITLANNMGCGI